MTKVAPPLENILENGRLPWYNSDGSQSQTFMIGIAGGSASGKTSVSDRVIKGINLPNVVLISMDSFYKVLSQEEIERANRQEHDFDSPASFDFNLLIEKMTDLKNGKKVEIPEYDFCTHNRTSNSTVICGSTVVVFEGIMALYHPKILELLDLKVFVDTDDDVRLARRLLRDISQRGRQQKDVLDMYFKFAKQGYDNHIFPTSKYADVIIPRGADNIVAIDLLIKHIKSLLAQRGINFRISLIEMCKKHKREGKILMPPNVFVLDSSNSVKNLLTIIRDSATDKEHFIEASHRLSSLVIEDALNFKEFIKNTVVTPTGATYEGLCSNDNICGVSIIRAGSVFEIPMRKILPEVCLGKFLVQTDKITGDPRLHFFSLPSKIDTSIVFLMDSSIASGATAMMAIKVLLDNGIPRDRICFLTLICAIEGLIALSHAFPQVKIICAAVDESLDENFFIKPGFGNFGARYFGI